MDSHREVAGNCIGGGEVNDINVCRSAVTGNGDDKADYAVDDDGRSLSELGSKGEEVVLAFDSLHCNTVDGVSKSVEVFRVEGCFVPDEVVVDEESFMQSGYTHIAS
ncbi:hypothetical protein L6452_39265 [Arctium lappa]|uniref:Uncharacterized protein n=1 Tax=Arctium lappa TaxID=4217 RepID=A0ACB8XSC9_ARCLA|nr:hypothetical protein L6452_39265 [Arctium lappa]